jgi:hypothetical protein
MDERPQQPHELQNARKSLGGHGRAICVYAG